MQSFIRRLTYSVILISTVVGGSSAMAQNKVVVIPLGESINGGNCPEKSYMAGIDSSGKPICNDLSSYINSHCYVYLGWRDAVDGDALAPVKTGRTNGTSTGCSVTGADNTCQTSEWFSESITSAGINPDGDVGGDDKLYVGFKCE